MSQLQEFSAGSSHLLSDNADVSLKHMPEPMEPEERLYRRATKKEANAYTQLHTEAEKGKTQRDTQILFNKQGTAKKCRRRKSTRSFVAALN